MEKQLLEYFKVMLVEKHTKVINYQFMTKGVLLDFVASKEQAAVIADYVRDSNVQTLFSVDEVSNLSADQKWLKQVSHYIFQSGVTNPVFDVVRSNDAKADTLTVTLIRGVTKKALQELVDETLYGNKPAKDTKVLALIIKHFKLKYRVNEVKNNELRVLLFDGSFDLFTSGDDAVRYIVNRCASSDLLIKSKQVLAAVQANPDVSSIFLTNHRKPLAQVFNRHKPILMALKIGSPNLHVKRLINQISRESKTAHVPYVMPKAKTFVHDAMTKFKSYKFGNLNAFTMRDKLKLLNLLEFKLEQSSTDFFTIRNGKVHVAENRPIYDKEQLNAVIGKVLRSIKTDLKDRLDGKKVILPTDLDYGLPVSRKQSVGHLPFGTKLTVDASEISSGIYWKDEWGAHDLDLSTIDEDGNRTGWGMFSGYNREHGVTFSGDITRAPSGAMEFMTSSGEKYGLFVNVFNGEVGCKTQVVVGEKSKKSWMDKTFLREELTLKARGNLVGLVRDKTFIVYYGRMNESRVSSVRNKVMIQKALTMRWTVRSLFDYLGIKYVAQAKKPDYDLSYVGFTYNKLEELFGI